MHGTDSGACFASDCTHRSPGCVEMQVNSAAASMLKSSFTCCRSPSTGSFALYRFHAPLCSSRSAPSGNVRRPGPPAMALLHQQ